MLGSFRGPRFRYFALVMAVIALAAGIYFAFFQARGFLPAESTIVSIEENGTDADNSTNYDVYVRYTVDGKEYTGLLNQYSPSYKVGDKVNVLYNPADPTDFAGASKGIAIYLIIIGFVMLAVVIISWVKEKKAQKELDQMKEATNNVAYAPSVPGPERELYFLTDLGTPKYGHRIEDRSRRVLYEAKMTKFTLNTPSGFDFIDHEHHKTTPHLIGHLESTEWGNSLLLDNHYDFTFDGEFIWKHLKRNGITVESRLQHGATLVGHSFQVFRDGNLIAEVESSSQYVHEEDAEAHKIARNVPVAGFYRIKTTETNLDLLFVTLLAFARSNATDDRGGNFQTMLNTVKGR